jgi:hypothetical protein
MTPALKPAEALTAAIACLNRAIVCDRAGKVWRSHINDAAGVLVEAGFDELAVRCLAVDGEGGLARLLIALHEERHQYRPRAEPEAA